MLKNSNENLKKWRIEKLNQCPNFPKYLYYFSNLDNIDSIVKSGILPKNYIIKENIPSESFANLKVQKLRKNTQCQISNKEIKYIHDLVPLYLNPKTPTLFSRRNIQDDIFFCLINSKNLLSDIDVNFAFTDGNATNLSTKFYYNLSNLNNLNWDIIKGEWWNDKTDGKRIRNAEFLIYPKIKVKYIEFISCRRHGTIDRLRPYIINQSIKLNVNKDLFFDTK